jgi:flagellar motor switch protein FliN/FliY
MITAPARAEEARLPDALGALPLTLTVRLGTARMTVRELTALGEGSLVTLDARIDAPLEVCVDGRVVARGDLIENEDGGLAVKLTETVG